MDSDTPDTQTTDTRTTDAPTTDPRATGTFPGDAGGTTTTETTAGPSCRPQRRLYRAGRGRMIGGVALGVADYLDVDPTVVRIGFVALTFLGGLAVPLYLAGWLLIPDVDTDLSLAEELFTRERTEAW
jgi:phage shock protein PspC (stress-responsive transcriptional regulator)